MAKQSLVIVESPAKAKTIGKYLGKDFEVKACMGHLRDLPKSKLGVDLEHDFEPDYLPIKEKKEIIQELKKAADKADMVYLATDPDREGEAISWHLKYLLDLPDEKARRVTFNEITKKVVQESIRSPRDIDQNLVDAQQARRILDRIVGYQLSPLLWRKIRRGLSAGRVQSVATRMVDDRDLSIEEFKPDEYWTLDAFVLADGEKKPFSVRYHGRNDKKVELKSALDVDVVIEETKDEIFYVHKVRISEKHRNPPPPFTTSMLQQEASRKLNMQPRRTMAVAQQLYEGIEIQGEGSVGLITYMRTDSLRLSEEALSAAQSFILDRYGEAYYPKSGPHRYKAKANAQDAHEAIRPSNVLWTPEKLRQDLTLEQYKLYRLIWSRFVACQMSQAIYDTVSVTVRAGEHDFHASSSRLRFSGFSAVYEESQDEDKNPKNDKENLQVQTLPGLQDGQVLTLKDYSPDQHFTQPPPHYTDASLIRAMEEQGIGRPSTYAPTVSTILDREYVVKEGKNLKITNLGRTVTHLMEDHFQDIADTGFTAIMEQKLDSVEEGAIPWKSVLRDFYGTFDENLQKAEHDLEGVRIKVPDEVTQEICPECGRNLVVKSGRFGRFLACPGFPDCRFTMSFVEPMPGRCPRCGGRLMKRSGTSRSNKHYTCYCCEFQNAREENQRCDFMTWDIPVQDDCPVCGQTMFKRAGRGSKKIFCINPDCANFLPEDQRGYWKKSVKTGDAEPEAKDGSTAKAETKERATAKEKAETKKKATAKEKAETKKKATAKEKAVATKKTAAKEKKEKTGTKEKVTATAKTRTRKKAATSTETQATKTGNEKAELPLDNPAPHSRDLSYK